MTHVRTTLTTALAAVAATGGLLAATAMPASAASFPTDHPRLLGAEVDFGLNWDTFGAPVNGGNLFWTLANGELEADLEGYLYMKNAAGDCAKVQVEYHDVAHDVLSVEESPTYCTASNGKVQFFINEEFADQYVDHVIVRLMEDNGANGTFSVVATGTFRP